MLLIESAIEREYLARSWKRFWPAQFVTTELSERDVLRGLKGLVESGKLKDEVFLRCPSGHVAWQGSPQDVHEGFEVVCRRCEQVAEAAEGVELQFTMLPGWIEHIEQLRAEFEKKKNNPLAM